MTLTGMIEGRQNGEDKSLKLYARVIVLYDCAITSLG
jgi:hypothetical protein